MCGLLRYFLKRNFSWYYFIRFNLYRKLLLVNFINGSGIKTILKNLFYTMDLRTPTANLTWVMH